MPASPVGCRTRPAAHPSPSDEPGESPCGLIRSVPSRSVHMSKIILFPETLAVSAFSGTIGAWEGGRQIDISTSPTELVFGISGGIKPRRAQRAKFPGKEQHTSIAAARVFQDPNGSFSRVGGGWFPPGLSRLLVRVARATIYRTPLPFGRTPPPPSKRNQPFASAWVLPDVNRPRCRSFSFPICSRGGRRGATAQPPLPRPARSELGYARALGRPAGTPMPPQPRAP